jgi:hypothetical protein
MKTIAAGILIALSTLAMPHSLQAQRGGEVAVQLKRPRLRLPSISPATGSRS